MCFSPQADVVGGLVICAIGIDAVRHVRQRREFLALAWIPLLPVFVPLAVIVLEPTRRRKLMMVPFASTGTVVAVILFAAMVRGPVGVTLAPYHLSYGIRVTDGLLIVVLYVVAVCGTLLISGYRDVVIFGAVNLVAVIVIAWLTVSGFASIWCAWAAVSSAAITLHCRLAKPGPHRVGTGLAA